MGTNFWWIYDILAAAIVVLSIYSCAKKGFSKIIVIVIGCVVSIFLASFVSQKSSQFIYDKFIKKTSIEAVEEAIEEYDPAVSVREVIEDQGYGAVLEDSKVKKILESDDSMERLYEYANQAAGDVVDTHENFKKTLTAGFTELFSKQLGVKLPPYVTHELTEKLSGNEKLFIETTEMLLKSPDDVPEYIEENYIRKPALRLIKAFVFIISYFIFMTLIRALIYKTFRFGLLNGYDRLDKFAGGLLGVVQAGAMLIVMAVIVKIMIHVAESEGSFISYETVEKTKLFRYVFDKVSNF